MSIPSLEDIIVEHGLESSYFDGVAYFHCEAKRVVAPDAAGNFPTDPAVEAAQRVRIERCERSPWWPPIPGSAGEGIAIAAAREALAPIRALHYQAQQAFFDGRPTIRTCAHCGGTCTAERYVRKLARGKANRSAITCGHPT